MYAVVAAGSMIYLAFAELLRSRVMISISIIVAWLPITILFVTGQYALAKIIMRAKWVTLNEIQTQIERIQSEENVAEREIMEKVSVAAKRSLT